MILIDPLSNYLISTKEQSKLWSGDNFWRCLLAWIIHQLLAVF